jgi:hypothetical protein
VRVILAMSAGEALDPLRLRREWQLLTAEKQ